MDFDTAVATVKKINGDSMSNEEKLELYGLYKQATVGDVNIPQPWAVQVTERAKHDAWSKHTGVSQEEAKKLYVAAAERLIAKYGLTE